MTVALLAGAGYFLIGRLFPQPAAHLRAWRVAAWVASGCVYATHICYEQFALGHSIRSTALHVATAVGAGGLALAIAGMIRSVSITGSLQFTWLLAIVVWPLVTAVPAFVVALPAGAIVRRFRRST